MPERKYPGSTVSIPRQPNVPGMVPRLVPPPSSSLRDQKRESPFPIVEDRNEWETQEWAQVIESGRLDDQQRYILANLERTEPKRGDRVYAGIDQSGNSYLTTDKAGIPVYVTRGKDNNLTFTTEPTPIPAVMGMVDHDPQLVDLYKGVSPSQGHKVDEAIKQQGALWSALQHDKTMLTRAGIYDNPEEVPDPWMKPLPKEEGYGWTFGQHGQVVKQPIEDPFKGTGILSVVGDAGDWLDQRTDAIMYTLLSREPQAKGLTPLRIVANAWRIMEETDPIENMGRTANSVFSWITGIELENTLQSTVAYNPLTGERYRHEELQEALDQGLPIEYAPYFDYTSKQVRDAWRRLGATWSEFKDQAPTKWDLYERQAEMLGTRELPEDANILERHYYNLMSGGYFLGEEAEEHRDQLRRVANDPEYLSNRRVFQDEEKRQELIQEYLAFYDERASVAHKLFEQGNVQEAIAAMVYLQEKRAEVTYLAGSPYEDALILRANSPYAAYTWANRPHRYQRFLEAVALYELSVGRPVSDYEIRKIRDTHFIDIGTEMAGGVFFDLNVISLMVGAAKLPFKGIRLGAQALQAADEGSRLARVADGFRWIGDTAPFRFGKATKEFVTGTSIASQTRRLGHDVQNLLYRAAYSTRTATPTDAIAGKKSLAEIWDEGVQAVASGDAEAIQAFIDAYPGMGRKQVDLIRQLNDIVTTAEELHGADNLPDSVKAIQPENVGRMFEAEAGRIYDQVFNNRLEFYGKKFKLADVTDPAERTDLLARIKKLAHEDAVAARSKPRSYAAVIASNYQKAFAHAHMENVDFGRLDDTIAATIANQFNVDKRLLKGYAVLSSGVNWLRGRWIDMVLPFRPAWTVYNFVDSSARYLLAGGEAYHSNDLGHIFTNKNVNRILSEEFMPSEIGETGARTLVRGEAVSESVFARMKQGWRPSEIRVPDWVPERIPFIHRAPDGSKVARSALWTPLGFFFGALDEKKQFIKALEQAKPAQTPLEKAWRKIANAGRLTWGTAAQAGRDANTAVEIVLRGNLLLQTYQPLFRSLDSWALTNLLAKMRARGIPEEVIAVFQRNWEMAGDDASKLRALMASSAGVKSDTIIHSHFLPETVWDDVVNQQYGYGFNRIDRQVILTAYTESLEELITHPQFRQASPERQRELLRGFHKDLLLDIDNKYAKIEEDPLNHAYRGPHTEDYTPEGAEDAVRAEPEEPAVSQAEPPIEPERVPEPEAEVQGTSARALFGVEVDPDNIGVEASRRHVMDVVGLDYRRSLVKIRKASEDVSAEAIRVAEAGQSNAELLQRARMLDKIRDNTDLFKSRMAQFFHDIGPKYALPDEMRQAWDNWYTAVTKVLKNSEAHLLDAVRVAESGSLDDLRTLNLSLNDHLRRMGLEVKFNAAGEIEDFLIIDPGMQKLFHNSSRLPYTYVKEGLIEAFFPKIKGNINWETVFGWEYGRDTWNRIIAHGQGISPDDMTTVPSASRSRAQRPSSGAIITPAPYNKLQLQKPALLTPGGEVKKVPSQWQEPPPEVPEAPAPKPKFEGEVKPAAGVEPKAIWSEWKYRDGTVKYRLPTDYTFDIIEQDEVFIVYKNGEQVTAFEDLPTAKAYVEGQNVEMGLMAKTVDTDDFELVPTDSKAGEYHYEGGYMIQRQNNKWLIFGPNNQSIGPDTLTTKISAERYLKDELRAAEQLKAELRPVYNAPLKSEEGVSGWGANRLEHAEGRDPSRVSVAYLTEEEYKEGALEAIRLETKNNPHAIAELGDITERTDEELAKFVDNMWKGETTYQYVKVDPGKYQPFGTEPDFFAVPDDTRRITVAGEEITVTEAADRLDNAYERMRNFGIQAADGEDLPAKEILATQREIDDLMGGLSKADLLDDVRPRLDVPVEPTREEAITYRYYNDERGIDRLLSKVEEARKFNEKDMDRALPKVMSEQEYYAWNVLADIALEQGHTRGLVAKAGREELQRVLPRALEAIPDDEVKALAKQLPDIGRDFPVADHARNAILTWYMSKYDAAGNPKLQAVEFLQEAEDIVFTFTGEKISWAQPFVDKVTVGNDGLLAMLSPNDLKRALMQANAQRLMEMSQTELLKEIPVEPIPGAIPLSAVPEELDLISVEHARQAMIADVRSSNFLDLDPDIRATVHLEYDNMAADLDRSFTKLSPEPTKAVTLEPDELLKAGLSEDEIKMANWKPEDLKWYKDTYGDHFIERIDPGTTSKRYKIYNGLTGEEITRQELGVLPRELQKLKTTKQIVEDLYENARLKLAKVSVEPVSDVKARVPGRPSGGISKTGKAVQPYFQQSYDNAISRFGDSIIDEVEELASQRLTAKQMSDELAKRHGGNAKDYEDYVKAIRIEHGIPSSGPAAAMWSGQPIGEEDAAKLFEDWLQSYKARVEPPKAVVPDWLNKFYDKYGSGHKTRKRIASALHHEKMGTKPRGKYADLTMEFQQELRAIAIENAIYGSTVDGQALRPPYPMLMDRVGYSVEDIANASNEWASLGRLGDDADSTNMAARINELKEVQAEREAIYLDLWRGMVESGEWNENFMWLRKLPAEDVETPDVALRALDEQKTSLKRSGLLTQAAEDEIDYSAQQVRQAKQEIEEAVDHYLLPPPREHPGVTEIGHSDIGKTLSGEEIVRPTITPPPVREKPPVYAITRVPKQLKAPSFWQMPDYFQSWMVMRSDARANRARLIRLIEDLEDHILEMSDAGRLDETLISKEQYDALSELLEEGTSLKQEAVNTALYGAENVEAFGGKPVTGAIETTGRHMLDYTKYSRLDELIKSAVPFWMFPSRSIPYWLDLMTKEPQFLIFYKNYLRGTDQLTYSRGGYNRDGEVLASLRGYVQIGDTGWWINPLAPLSFQLVLKRNSYYADEEELIHLSPTQRVAYEVMMRARSNGFHPGPMLSYLTTRYVNNSGTSLLPEYGLIPVTSLLPPWTQRSIEADMQRIMGWYPEWMFDRPAPWQDYMVEVKMLENFIAGSDGMTEEQKMAEIERIKEALGYQECDSCEGGYKLAPREDNPLWLDTLREVQESQYGREMLGWFTGAYAKEFTDARAELMRLRDQRNKLADSINNAGMAEIFRLDPAPEARYQHYINNTYNTAEGNAAMMYGQLGWVRAADGSEIQDDLRRDRIAELIHEDQITKEFYDNLTSLGEARDAQLMELPIGADSSQSRAVWKKYWNMVERLESDPKYENVRRTYVLGFKPTEMIEDYFERKFWQHLDSTKPRWRRDEGESYNDYLLREDAWKEHLPKLADQMVTEFFLKYMAGYSGKVPGDREFDAQNLASKLLSEVSREAYDEYRKDRDTPYDALNEAWRALYWDPYWTAVDTVDSDDPAEVELREQIERQFLAEHPEPPTEEELLAWVLKEYDDRFTHEELMLAMKGRKVTELDERLRADTMVGTLKEDTWNIFMWVGPGEQFNAFKNEALRMGVDEEEFALWFETGGDISFFKSYEEQQEFNDKLMEAARNLNITPPTDEQLQERVEAKRLNSQFRMGVERELGNGWYQEMSYFYSLNSTEKKAFKEENPTFEDRLDRYYDMRDFFAQENPLWAEYYHSEALEESKRGTSGGRSGGYSGRSYARSGGTSVQQVPTIPWLGMGMRGLEADELLTGKLGKGGVTKKPYWPAGFTKVVGQGVSQEIVRFIENDEPLSNPAINLLNDVKERHEKYKEFIETILHGGGGGPYLIE